MTNDLFNRFAPIIRDMNDASIQAETRDPHRLLVEEVSAGGKVLKVAYAPFDHVNDDARIVIVGLTPGRQQMSNALIELRRQLRAGASERVAKSAAKVFASFSGPMRSNLIAMLDAVGVSKFLGIATTASLWAQDERIVHFTSALRYPVLVDGRNFSGSPSIMTTPLLRLQLTKWFAAEMLALPKALLVPLGPAVCEAVIAVARETGFDRKRILTGLPHLSGANAERIAFFLGRKPREALSLKVAPDKLLAARACIEAQIAGLAGHG